MNERLPVYEVYAIRYATRSGQRPDHFIGGDLHHGPMPMDYFVWAIIGPGGPFVVDVGFSAEVSDRRKRTYLRSPVDGLKLIGVDAAEVRDVIVTHLHYDHAGNFDCFPKARFHLQEQELAYATGPYMQYPFMNHPFEIDDVTGVVRLNYRGRVAFHAGRAELTPGLVLELAGGHSAGLQFVRVHTRRGWLVLASDVMHYYENLTSGRPFTTAFHVGDMLAGFSKLNAAASDLLHIIPGHDPQVMRLFPAPRPALEGIVVRLDAEPIAGVDLPQTDMAGH
ncbi:MAG: N-acyl homoserine lactonase family protein [Xanthobacteraceae bacterium]